MKTGLRYRAVATLAVVLLTIGAANDAGFAQEDDKTSSHEITQEQLLEISSADEVSTRAGRKIWASKEVLTLWFDGSDEEVLYELRRQADGGNLEGLLRRVLKTLEPPSYSRHFDGDVSYDASLRVITEEKALSGNRRAQWLMGEIAAKGLGVEADFQTALQWHQKAAEQRYAPSYTALGFLVFNGKGTEKNAEKAASWFRQGAQGGDPVAQYTLGRLYEKGNGVNRDEAEASRWYGQSARGGYAPAQYSLALLYDLGRGVMQSNREAARWYEAAAKKGHNDAQKALGLLYSEGRGVALDMKQAAFWLGKSAAGGDADAQNFYGWLYQTGQGVALDRQVAAQWFRKAALQGNVTASYNLGVLMEGQKKYFEACKWLYLARLQGHRQAEARAARVAQVGRLTASQIKKARQEAKEFLRRQ